VHAGLEFDSALLKKELIVVSAGKSIADPFGLSFVAE